MVMPTNRDSHVAQTCRDPLRNKASVLFTQINMIKARIANP